MSDAIAGTCACGAVQFTSQAEPLIQLFCHCRDCQQATGAAFARTAFFRLKASHITGALTARPFVAASGSKTTREACAACGTLMFDRSERFPALVGVMAERLSRPFVFRPSCHVWVRSQREDTVISDGLPQHAEDFTG